MAKKMKDAKVINTSQQYSSSSVSMTNRQPMQPVQMDKSMLPDFSNQSYISPLQQFPSSQKPQVLADQHAPI